MQTPQKLPQKSYFESKERRVAPKSTKAEACPAVCGEASATGVSRVVLPAQSSRRGIGKQMDGVLEEGYEQVRVVSQKLCADQPKVCATGY